MEQYGMDTPRWRWSDKREFSMSLAYSMLMGIGEQFRNSKWHVICLCRMGPEDIDHVLQFCPKVRDHWVSVLDRRLLIRCNMIFEPDGVNRDSELAKGYMLIAECEAAFASSRSSPNLLTREEEHWEGPRLGWIKGNVDATSQSMEGSVYTSPSSTVTVYVKDEKRWWKEQCRVANSTT
ncbi:hypothetical protein V6N13_071568 [Hibiscus sabdariffa]